MKDQDQDQLIDELCRQLALQNIAKKWTKPIQNWRAALNQFAIAFEERVPLYV